MLARRSLPLLLSLLGLGLLAASALASEAVSPFPCTGGSIYFTGHNADSLLYQNPDVLRELYVYKCVTTVVFTSDTGGETANETRVVERESALEEAYRFMNAAPTEDQAKWVHGDNSDEPFRGASIQYELPPRKATTIQVGKYNISASSFDDMPNVQILYLRLPDSPHDGSGYEAYGESLKKLYQEKIPSITTVDQTATYTLQDLKDVIATILRERRATDIGILNHKIDFEMDHSLDIEQEHTDRITSAKIVLDVIGEANISANVYRYASDVMSTLSDDLNDSDYVKKTGAFFAYAWYDPAMCHDLEQCDAKLKNAQGTRKDYEEGDHISEFLKREWYEESVWN